MLPSARRRQLEIAAKEAAGESVWVDELDRRALVRIAEWWSVLAKDMRNSYGRELGDEVAEGLRRAGGWDIQSYGPTALRNVDNDDLALDAIAAAREIVGHVLRRTTNIQETYDKVVNSIFNEYRIAHKFVDGELIPFKSDELLQEVVEPTLRLLIGGKFKPAHDSYLKALKEISANEPGDAITDAGTALQGTLEALGCNGNALGPLLTDAKKIGLLAGHDQNLIDGILKFAHWASADRSESGDAHKHSEAALADAWLMVHVVGALIVRLVDPAKRGK